MLLIFILIKGIMRKTYFISDVHIGANDNNEKFEKLITFLDYINEPDNILYIVGDLFDFWFEYKHVIPKNNYAIFFQFSKLIKNNVEIHFIPGNHDYWIVDFFQKEIGFIVHPEVIETELQSKKIYLFHGDGISKKDIGYQVLKKILRNPLNIFFYRLLHPDFGIPLARLTSNTSRHHTANLVLNDEQDYIDFAIDKFKKGFDIVVVGHSHRPSLDHIDGKYLINLGDWIEHFSYGVLSNGQIELKFWNP